MAPVLPRAEQNFMQGLSSHRAYSAYAVSRQGLLPAPCQVVGPMWPLRSRAVCPQGTSLLPMKQSHAGSPSSIGTQHVAWLCRAGQCKPRAEGDSGDPTVWLLRFCGENQVDTLRNSVLSPKKPLSSPTLGLRAWVFP